MKRGTLSKSSRVVVLGKTREGSVGKGEREKVV